MSGLLHAMTDPTPTSSRMRCTATGQFSCVGPPQYYDTPPYITVYIPLSPRQFQQLCDNDPILPNPYNGPFHLRSNQTLAVQKAHEHMMWKDDGRGNGKYALSKPAPSATWFWQKKECYKKMPPKMAIMTGTTHLEAKLHSSGWRTAGIVSNAGCVHGSYLKSSKCT